MRVGIVGYLHPRGIAYDGLAVLGALAGREDVETRIFPVADLYEVDRALRRRGRLKSARPVPGFASPEAVARGELGEFARGCDAVITFEAFSPRLARIVRKSGGRSVHVVNYEWVPEGDRAITELAEADVVVAKTAHTAEELARAGLRNVAFVPWSTDLPPERAARPAGPVVFLHLAGVGSSVDAKNPEAVLHGFAASLAGDPAARLIVHAQVPFRRRKRRFPIRPFRKVPNIEIREGPLPRAAVLDLIRSAHVAVQPSRMEGFGLTHLECLTLGAPVITTDAPPMNELIHHERNGLLVPAQEAGRHRRVPILEVDRQAIAQAMLRITRDADLLAHLQQHTHDVLPTRREAFRTHLHQALALPTL